MSHPIDDPHVNPSTGAPDELPDGLRWQLRALRRDAPPARDLWPGIVAQLPTTREAPAGRRWTTPVAIAATLVIALGAAGLWRSAPPATSPTLVQREAAGMARQYNAALREIASVPAAPGLQPTLDELDRDTTLILAALADDPDSQLLLNQLRRTYSYRLALARRTTHRFS